MMIEEYWEDVTLYSVSYKFQEGEAQSDIFVFPTELKLNKIKSILFDLFTDEGTVESIEIDEYCEALQLRI